MSDKSVGQQAPTPKKKPEPKKAPVPKKKPSQVRGPNSFQPGFAPPDATRVAPVKPPPGKKETAQTPPKKDEAWWKEHEQLDQAEQRKPEIDKEAMQAAATDLHRAMSGWGTDEDGVFDALRGKSPAEIAAIRNEFKKHYDADLDEWIKDEMGGDDLKEAQALMKGDKVAGVIAGLENSTGFWNDDEAKIESLMRDLNPKELEKLKAHPKWKSVRKQMKDALGGEDEEVFNALEDGDKAKASAVRLDEAMGSSKSWYNPTSWGTDEDGVYENLSNLPAEERKAAEKAFNDRMAAKGEKTTLRDELGKELSTADETRAVASLENDTATEAAAKIEQTMEGLGTDEDTLFKELEGLPEAKREEVLAAYEKKFGKSLDDRLKEEVGGRDHERASMAANGAQDDTFKLFYGMKGFGTDEQLLKDSLKGKSKDQINEMREKWNSEYADRYGADFDAAFSSELSGRDHFDIVEIGLRGEPQTPQEKIEIMEMQYDYERGSRSTWVGRNMMDFAGTIGFSDSARVLDMQNERLQEAIGPDGKVKAPDSAIDDLYGYTQDDVEDYRAAKDSVTEAIATGAEITVATVATIATSGSASPWLAAALSSALGSAVGMGTKALMQGEAYGIESVGSDALAGALGAGLAGLGESAKMFEKFDEISNALGPRFAAKVAEESGSPMARRMYLGTMKGMTLGTGHGIASGLTNEDNLRSGFGDYLGGIATGAGTGLLRGGFAGFTSGTTSGLVGQQFSGDTLTSELSKEITQNVTTETLLTATDFDTWAGRPEDVLLRFAGSTAKGVMGGIAEGGRDHRQNVAAAKLKAAQADVDAPKSTPDATQSTPDATNRTPDVQSTPDVDAAPKAPMTDAQLLDRLIDFEASGGSKELVDYALDHSDDRAMIEKLLSDHGG